MQGKPLQVPSLVELFHDIWIVDKLKWTRVPLIGEHVGNVWWRSISRKVLLVGHRVLFMLSSSVRAREELDLLGPVQNRSPPSRCS
jgi:hypothetical protein